MENMEPELAIFLNQASLPVVGLGHQPSYKTCPACKMYWDSGGSELEGVANQWSNTLV